MSRLRTTLAVTGVLATTLVLAACSTGSGSMSDMSGMGGGSTASPAPMTADGPVNDADIAFATMMIPHHRQAIDMADTILAKSGVDNRIMQLASDIKAAQGPEIDTMSGWLDDWGQAAGGMSGMDHGGDGMMSDADMAALDKATGADAGRLFLQQMIQHHNGAIEMAQTELGAGKNPDALALAGTIVEHQKAEVATMQGLLGSL